MRYEEFSWIPEKTDGLLWPSMTFKVIFIKIKYLRIHNISIHINFYQNRLINECVRKNFLKFSERQTKRRSFFVRCRRTYVLNNLLEPQFICEFKSNRILLVQSAKMVLLPSKCKIDTFQYFNSNITIHIYSLLLPI